MAGSPIFSVNFTNRKNSAVLNYHKSWSWSNQPVLWDFYIMFLPCFCWSRVFGYSLPFSVQSMAWQVTFDVITSSPFIRPPRKTGGKSLYALVPFWSWNTLQHYLVDVMMKQKSFFVQGNLNLALMYRNNIEFSVFVLCHWVDCEKIGCKVTAILLLRSRNCLQTALVAIWSLKGSKNYSDCYGLLVIIHLPPVPVNMKKVYTHHSL